jgi:hypothetical protein
METNLKAFMKPELKDDAVIELPGIEAFKGEDGKPIPFKLKRLSRGEIDKIRQNNTTKTVVKDKRTNRPMVSGNNRIVYDEQYDSDTATKEIMVECFVFPDLKSKELRDFYKVDLNTDLPEILFRGKDWEYANKCVMIACGMADEDTEEEILGKAKN